MKRSELQRLVKVAYEQVGLRGRDAAQVYHAIVELDRQVLALRAELDKVLGETDYRPDC